MSTNATKKKFTFRQKKLMILFFHFDFFESDYSERTVNNNASLCPLKTLLYAKKR